MAEHGSLSSSAIAVKRLWKTEKLATLLLLFVLLTAATAGVTAVLTGPDWASLWESLLIGLLLGWIMAVFGWPAWRSALLVVVLGVLFCLFFAGGLNERVLKVIGEAFRLAAQIPGWMKTGEIDLSSLAAGSQQLASALAVVFNRIITWVKDLSAGQATFDPVAAGIVWSMVVWLVSAWAGWVVEARHSTLAAVLPALGMNLSALSYGRSTSPTIYLTLGATLVLVALVQYDTYQRDWEVSRVAYPEREGRQVRNVSIALTIGLILLAAFISSLSLKRIEQWTSALNHPASQENSGLAQSLGIQQPTPTPGPFSNALAPGLPRDLLIGSGPDLSHEQVMSVEVKDLARLVQAGHLPPLYWRSYTYDSYTGHGWTTSPVDQAQYQPNQPIQAGLLPDHQLVEETVNAVPGQGGTLYAAGEPVLSDSQVSAAWRSRTDLFGIQTSSSSYTVQSLVPLVGEDSLRAAGQDYPSWITQRYLELPAEVPNRVKQLAIQLTAAEPTPYDRARAIEQYLRTTYSYSTDVPYPPPTQDLVDYFLFDLRKGYCDYFASSMVVLARAAGIPARLAIGYASGTFNVNSKRFIVTQAEAHSWAEVYFPMIGWIPFEPTADQPEINRSAQAAIQPTPIHTPSPVTPGAGTSSPSGKLRGYIAIGSLALLGFSWAIFDELYLRQLPPRRAAAEIYRRIQRYGHLLHVPSEGGLTPHEYSLAMQVHLQGAGGEKSGIVQSINSRIGMIIQIIVRLSYRPADANETSKLELLRQWSSLRWRLRTLWLVSLWNALEKTIRRVPGDEGENPWVGATGMSDDGK